MNKPEFTPSLLKSERGILHVLQIVCSGAAFILALINYSPLHTFWVWCTFTWMFCPIITLIITIIELFLINLILKFLNIMDWDDFALGMTVLSAMMMFSASVIFPVFYACPWCFVAIFTTVMSWLSFIAYAIEAVRGKLATSGTYLSILPGFIKLLEAFVTCIIFISLTGYVGRPGMYWCIFVYVIPFPITLFIIVANVLTPLRNCLPFGLRKFVIVFLVVAVLLYITAAIIWPIYGFRGISRSSDCGARYCIWNVLFVVTIATYVNLSLYTVDLILTLLGICGF